jgi:Uma2 family endonuclease
MKTVFVSEETFDQESFAAFVASLPDHDLSKYELIKGRIIMNPPSSWPYGEAEANALYILKAHVKSRDLGMVCGSTQGYELPTGHTVAPDASVILKSRLQRGPRPVAGKFLRIVPNLAIEVLLPTSGTRDRGVKKDVYAAAGVDEYWLVDLATRSITVLHLLPGGVYDSGEVFRAGQRVLSQVLPGLEAPVDEFFPSPGEGFDPEE